MLNRVIVIGRLVADIELRKAGQNVVAKNTLAVQKNYKNKEGLYQSVFLNFEAWGSNAEFLNKYVGKGEMVCLEGELDTNTYEKDGKKITSTYIKVASVQPLTFKQKDPKRDDRHSPSVPNLLDATESVNEFFAGTGVQVENEIKLDTDSLPFY